MFNCQKASIFLQNYSPKLFAKQNLFLQKCTKFKNFHTTTPKQAVPLAIIAQQVAKFTLIISGRRFRQWWKLLPVEKKIKYRTRLLSSARYFGVIGVVGLGAGRLHYVNHLEETPFTGRKRYMAINNEVLEELINQETTSLTEQIKSSVVPSHHHQTRRVVEIFNTLIAANSKLPGIKRDWKVVVVDDASTVNAMCLPSGLVLVFTGLLDFVETDHQLALVLAHELSHVLLDHGRELLSKAGVWSWITIGVVGLIWSIFPSDITALLGQALHSYLLTLMLHLPHSRLLEKEADEVGLDIMARACFNLEEGVRFWELMDAMEDASDSKIPVWFSSHPLSEDRAKYISDLMPRALAIQKSCGCDPRNSNGSHVDILGKLRLLTTKLLVPFTSSKSS